MDMTANQVLHWMVRAAVAELQLERRAAQRMSNDLVPQANAHDWQLTDQAAYRFDSTAKQLRITRPAFLEGIRAYKASQGVANFDPNKQATAQEMRSYVCGQCHVEYYFRGDGKRLTFPWADGLKVDDALLHEDEVKQVDWTHSITGASMLKAQHPEFEMYQQGVHARSGVACADCHMPYKREGGFKISDHQVRSPLLNLTAPARGAITSRKRK
jgi:nitrite reductase (cytochrome c-552)